MIDNVRPTPIDFSYDDPFEVTIPIHVIVARAERVRARRRVGLTFGLLLLVALGVTAVEIVPSRPGRGGGDPLAALHNAGDPLVVVDRSQPGWESFVYVSTDQSVCGGSVATGGSDKGEIATTCWTSVADATTGTWVIKPVFQTLPAPWANNDNALAIGLVRGTATKVVVTFRGVAFAATVVPVAIHGATGLGAYTLRMPVGGLERYGSSDITSVIAEDSAGNIVGQTR